MNNWIAIVDSVVAAFISVLVPCFVGALMLVTGSLPQDFSKSLSVICERVLIPCLVLTTLLQTIKFETLPSTLPIALAAISIYISGYICGLLVGKYYIRDDRLAVLISYLCANAHVCQQLAILLQSLSDHYQIDSELPAYMRATRAVMIITALSTLWVWTIGRAVMVNFSQQQAINKLVEPESTKGYYHWIINLPFPFLAIALAVFIICIPSLQSQLLDKSSFLHIGIFTPFISCGRAATPCVFIVLGMNICGIIRQGLVTPGFSTKQLLVLSTWRLVVGPIIALTMVIPAIYVGLISDPMDIWAIMFSCATPCAANIIVQARLYTNQEGLISVMLGFSYCVALISLPMWNIIFFNVMFKIQ